MVTPDGLLKIEERLSAVLKKNMKADAFLWLEDKVESLKVAADSYPLRLVFAQLPKFTGKQVVKLTATELAVINSVLLGFTMQDWTLERICRVWVLMKLPKEEKISYLQKINDLFDSAEMNELVALYAALPVLSYAEEWVSRCEEGIRSNIGSILEAIMYNNPYPAHFLSEDAWNQMVLKAFFTDKDVHQIVGLQERANPKLAATLKDYIEERLAAHRTVNPEIYKLLY